MNDDESKGPGRTSGDASGDAKERQSAGAERRARVARALRANLGRRKAQARQRRDPADLGQKIPAPPKLSGAD